MDQQDKEALERAYSDMMKNLFQNYVLDQDYDKLKRGLIHLRKSRDTVINLLAGG